MKTRNVWSRHARAALLGCFIAGLPIACAAGEFSVHPIRIFLDKDRKSDVVTVKNTGAVPLKFEIRPKEWTQNSSGEDVYTDTPELLVFPRLMVLKAGEDRDIRIGMKIPPSTTEKTYRVYITELPPTNPSDNAGQGANVGFLVNFALPVFFAPRTPAPALEVASFDLTNGHIKLTLANRGNVHHLVQEMSIIGFDASGAEVYREPINDRYFLAGTTKSYAQDITAQNCGALAVISFNVRTDKTSANAKRGLDKNSCGSDITQTPALDTEH